MKGPSNDREGEILNCISVIRKGIARSTFQFFRSHIGRITIHAWTKVKMWNPSTYRVHERSQSCSHIWGRCSQCHRDSRILAGSSHSPHTCSRGRSRTSGHLKRGQNWCHVSKRIKSMVTWRACMRHGLVCEQLQCPRNLLMQFKVL